MDHLWSAILHQGTASPAAGPASLVIAGFLLDPQHAEIPALLRAHLTRFLAAVGEVFAASGTTLEELQRWAAHAVDARMADDESLYEDEESANAIHARGILGC